MTMYLRTATSIEDTAEQVWRLRQMGAAIVRPIRSAVTLIRGAAGSTRLQTGRRSLRWQGSAAGRLDAPPARGATPHA